MAKIKKNKARSSSSRLSQNSKKLSARLKKKSPVRKAPARNRVVIQKSTARKVIESLENIVADVVHKIAAQPSDLVTAIKQDHDDLRQFIGVLKDTGRPLEERKRAFKQFSALLKSHTVAEEEAVYKNIEKHAKKDLVIRIEEGFVEHRVADDVMERLGAAKDPVIWSAHANVLAELVEHHLDEEEDELFPLMRQQIQKEKEADAVIHFLSLRGSTQAHVTEKNEGVLTVLR